jgi:AraC family transcriptional regulator
MKLQTFQLDRGAAADPLVSSDAAMSLRLGAVSRSASAGIAESFGSVWLVVRGKAQLDCREGAFDLQAGDWLVLERDSKPTLVAGRHALVLCLLLPSTGTSALESAQPAIFPGRGRISLADRQLALRLWRHCGAFDNASRLEAGEVLLRLLGFLSVLQQDLVPYVQKCPGRSLRRKRQVFSRMQRARLYLDANYSRNVRLSELADMASFSTWYFTKTFHALYDEGPRDVTALLRVCQGAELLARTPMSIGEVAAACGFENPCSFARAFRARYGVTATVYRRRAAMASTPIHVPRTGIREWASASIQP